MSARGRVRDAMKRCGFAVHVDHDRTTSGQRFWLDLAECLRAHAVPKEQARTVLFNITAPLSEIARAKLAGQRVVLRVDGLYFDRLSEDFLRQFRSRAFRDLLRLLGRNSSTHTLACEVA